MFKGLTKKQEDIIKISLDLISQKGVKGLTIRNIAEKNGTVESAIYRHFRNKNEILHAIIDILRKNSLPATYTEDKDTLSQIEATLNSHFKTFSAFPSIVSVLFCDSLFTNNEELLSKVKEVSNEGLFSITKIIKTGQEKSEIREDIDANHLAITVSGSFRMFLKKWKMSDYGFDLISEGDKFSQSIKKLLMPIKTDK